MRLRATCDSKGFSDAVAGNKAVQAAAVQLASSNLKVKETQAALTTAITKYGADSLKAQRATVTLATAQQQAGAAAANLARAQKDASTETVKAGDAAEHAHGRFSKLGAVMAGGLVAGGIVVAVKGAVGAIGGLIASAESLGDAQARVGLVFGESAAAVNAAAESNANALGMSRQAYLDASGAVGQYLQNLGVAGPQLAEMSTGMTDLAPKLAAFAGVPVDQAMDALQKGVGGATRGLKEMGIAVGDIPKGLSEAEAAAYIYQQVLDQSANAQAAWADNSGDVDVSMQRVTAAMEDAKAAIGEKLLPAIAPLMEALADKLPAALDLVMKGIDVVGDGWDALVKAAKPIVDMVKKLADGFGGSSGSGLSGAMDKLKTAAQPVIDLFRKLQPLVKQAFDGIEKAVSKIDLGAFGALFSAVGDVVASAAKLIGDNWGIIAPIISASIQVITSTLGVLVDIVMGGVRIVTSLLRGDFSGAWQAAKDMVSNVVAGIGDILDGLIDYVGSLAKLALTAALGIGRSIVDGIKDGIGKAWGAFTGWIHDQIMKIPEAVRKALGISSPSKVFMAIGRQIIEGLRVGLSSWRGDVQDELADMISAFDALDAALRRMNRGWSEFLNSAENERGSGTLAELTQLIWGYHLAGGKDIEADFRRGQGKYGSFDETEKGRAGRAEVDRLAGEYRAAEAMEDPAKMAEAWAALRDVIEETEAARAKFNETEINARRNEGVISDVRAEALLAAEKNRQEAFEEWMANVDEQIAASVAAAAGAWATYEEKVQAAQDAIEAFRDAQLDYAQQVYDRTVTMLQAEYDRREQAHDDRLAQLDGEDALAEKMHDYRLGEIEKLRAAEATASRQRTDALEEARRAGEAYIASLDLSGAQRQLQALQSAAQGFRSLMGGMEEVDPDPKKQAAKDKARADARVRLVSDEQKAALQAALSAGKIGDQALRQQAQLWAQGQNIRRADAEKIIDLIGDSLDREAAKQAAVVTGLEARIAARQAELQKAQDLAETEERASQDRLTALGERETAENRMYAGIVAGLAEQRRMEEDNWKHVSAQFDAHQKALDEAHAKRMAQIEEEAALELLRLGHTEAEVLRILAEQRDTARRIGDEAYQAYLAFIQGLGNASGNTRFVLGDIEERFKTITVLGDEWLMQLQPIAQFMDPVVVASSEIAASWGKTVENLVDARRELAEFQKQGEIRDRRSGRPARPNQTSKIGHGGYRVAGFLTDPDNTMLPEAELPKLGGVAPTPAGPRAGGGTEPSTVNLELHLDQPVLLDSEMIGIAVERVLIRRGIQITLAATGG